MAALNCGGGMVGGGGVVGGVSLYTLKKNKDASTRLPYNTLSLSLSKRVTLSKFKKQIANRFTMLNSSMTCLEEPMSHLERT